MEQSYLNLVKDCIENGDFRIDRTKGAYSLFGKQLIFDLNGNLFQKRVRVINKVF
jgi:thymidylate synthase